MTLVCDPCRIGGPVKQLYQAAAGESAGFEDVLHGLVVGVGVGADVAVMLEGPGDAVAGGVLDEAGGRDAVDGDVGIVVEPGAVDVMVGGVFAGA